jgi:hypothetical protein
VRLTPKQRAVLRTLEGGPLRLADVVAVLGEGHGADVAVFALVKRGLLIAEGGGAETTYRLSQRAQQAVRLTAVR